MYSKVTEEVIAELNEFLEYRHPSSVLQFITTVMVGWTHFDKKQPPGKADIDLAWGKYFTLFRNSIDRRLSLISSQSYSSAGREQKVLKIPPHVYEKKKIDKVVSQLGGMPLGDALDFMVEVTTNWCFSMPRSFLPLLPDAPPDESDEAIANAVYTWLVRYYDLWP